MQHAYLLKKIKHNRISQSKKKNMMLDINKFQDRIKESWFFAVLHYII